MIHSSSTCNKRKLPSTEKKIQSLAVLLQTGFTLFLLIHLHYSCKIKV